VLVDPTFRVDVPGDYVAKLIVNDGFLSSAGGQYCDALRSRLGQSKFHADLSGIYVAQLIVNNGLLNSAPATVTITTNSSPANANAGPNQLVNVGKGGYSESISDGWRVKSVHSYADLFSWSAIHTGAGGPPKGTAVAVTSTPQ
jgi:hypothetical protein